MRASLADRFFARLPFLRNPKIVALLLALGGAAFYFKNINDSFLSDDWVLIANAHAPRAFLDYLLANNLGGTEGGAYRPLFALFWKLGSLLGGEVWPLHLILLAFHAGTVALVYFLARRLWNDGTGSLFAFLAAALFALAPNHPEAVIWLASSADVIGTFFFLLALLFYFQSRETSGKRSVMRYVAAILAFVFSLLSKEMMITFPAIIALFELFHLRRQGFFRSARTAILRVLPFGLLLILYFLIRLKATGIFFGYYGAPKLAIDFFVVVRSYLAIPLSSIFSGMVRTDVMHALYRSITEPIHVFLLVTIFGGVLLLARPRKNILWAIGALILSIVPVMQFGINFIPNRVSDEGERYAYLPSVFVALIAAAFFTHILSTARLWQRAIGWSAVAMLSFALAFPLVQKVFEWDAASKKSDAILASWVREHERAPSDGVVTIGLPDNDRGVYLWRNGFEEALSERYGIVPDQIIVPIRTVSETASAFRLEQRGPSLFYQSLNKRDIVGTPRYRSADFSSDLVTPDISHYALSYREFAHAATMTFSPEFQKTNAERAIIVLYWTGRGFNRIQTSP